MLSRLDDFVQAQAQKRIGEVFARAFSLDVPDSWKIYAKERQRYRIAIKRIMWQASLNAEFARAAKKKSVVCLEWVRDSIRSKAASLNIFPPKRPDDFDKRKWRMFLRVGNVSNAGGMYDD